MPGSGQCLESVADSADADRALAAYHARIAACTRCVAAGHIPEANPVFHGYAHQRVMLVGQAPGARGHETGVPWSGPIGDILRGWLERAGFPAAQWRETWYLTSLTKCFPGKATTGKGDRAPSAAEIALCGDHLATELAFVRPEIIVTLGRLAATRFVPGARKMPLAELVGARFTVDLDHGPAVIVPLPHPSGVSRWLNDPANRERLATGLALLGQERERRGL